MEKTGTPFQELKTGGSYRDVPVPKLLNDTYVNWREETRNSGDNPRDLVLFSEDGNPMNAGKFRDALKGAAKKAAPEVRGSEPLKVAWRSPHIARSGCAKLYMGQGGSIRDLARFLGHGDDAQTSMGYLRWAPSNGSTPQEVLDKTIVGIDVGTE